MAKEINQVSFEIEHYNGSTYLGFVLSIKDDGSVEVLQTENCNLADTDGDYLFNTDNDLHRIQADNPITEMEYQEICECYEKHK